MYTRRLDFQSKGCSSRSTSTTGIVIVAITVMVLFCVSDVSATSPTRFRLCGQYLVQALSFVCGTQGYHSDFKRTSNLTLIKRVQRNGYSNGGGISDECCTNTCTLRNLESYCASSATDDNRLPPDGVQADFSPVILGEETMTTLRPNVVHASPTSDSIGHGNERHYLFHYHADPRDGRLNVIFRKAHRRR